MHGIFTAYWVSKLTIYIAFWIKIAMRIWFVFLYMYVKYLKNQTLG